MATCAGVHASSVGKIRLGRGQYDRKSPGVSRPVILVALRTGQSVAGQVLPCLSKACVR